MISTYKKLSLFDNSDVIELLKRKKVREEVLNRAMCEAWTGETLLNLQVLQLKRGDYDYLNTVVVTTRTSADRKSETANTDIFSIPSGRISGVHPSKPVNLHSLIVDLELSSHNTAYNASPSLFFSTSRKNLASEIGEAISRLGSSNGGNRIIAGIRGIGKTLFCKKAASVLSVYPHFISIYVSYETCTLRPFELLLAACIHHNIDVPADAESDSSILQYVILKGYNPIFFVDEMEQLYENHQKKQKTLDILREFMIILECVDARVFFFGSQSLITKLIDRDAYKEYNKLNSSRVSTTKILPLIEKSEFKEFLESFSTAPVTEDVLEQHFISSGGILRNVTEQRDFKPPSIDFELPVSVVWQMIYQKNSDNFDPFNQNGVTSWEILQRFDNKITQVDIDSWVDKGYLLEKENKLYCLVYPSYYHQMKTRP